MRSNRNVKSLWTIKKDFVKKIKILCLQTEIVVVKKKTSGEK